MIKLTDRAALVAVKEIAKDSGEYFFAGNFGRAIDALDRQAATIAAAIEAADDAGEVNWEQDNYAAGAQMVAAILDRTSETPKEGTP